MKHRNGWEQDAGTLELLFKGLGDSSRLRILNLLIHGELCGCDIQYVLDVSQSNISRHLTYLKNSGLVQDRRAGYRVYYRLTHRHSGDHKLLFDYLSRAFKRDIPFTNDIKKLKAAIGQGACSVSDSEPVLKSPKQSSQKDLHT